MPASDPLDRLLDRRSDLWRGRGRTVSGALATGHPRLDRLLPGGGWPCGRLIELLPEPAGAGELQILLPMMAERTRQRQPVVLAAPPMVPCPQALAAAGVDLDQLVVVRQAEQAAWAAEQCLKSGLCGAVVLWPPGKCADTRAVRRLRLAAGDGPAPLFVCYRPGRQPPSSLSSLRLAIRPGPVLEVLRAHGTAAGGMLDLGTGNVAPLRSQRPAHRPQPVGNVSCRLPLP